MKKIFYTCLTIMLLSQVSYSQDFDSAVGLRFGYPLSVTYKTFISETAALEGYVGYRNYAGSVSFFNINAAYQIHQDIEDVDQLQWYYGGGGNIAFWSGDFLDRNTSIGISGYAGLSYTFPDIPLNLSIDWVPTFFINGNAGFANGFSAGYGSLAARYVLSSDSN